MKNNPTPTPFQDAVELIGHAVLEDWVTNAYPGNVDVAKIVRKMKEDLLTDIFQRSERTIESQAKAIEILSRQNENYHDYIMNYLKKDPEKVLAGSEDAG